MKFNEIIISWYLKHRRDLPWRKTKNPYKIWVSEIILQQTRVNQGLSYYLNFIKKFPSIESLANAEEVDVLKVWEGLGYYSRARNMHNAAKYIINEFNGCFPNTYNDIIKLKGIGVYTASAISSICFNEVKAVVDGNVKRVLARYFNTSEPVDSVAGNKIIQAQADMLIDKDSPGDFNQAIMEIGALICSPVNPNCLECPLNTDCYAHINNIVDSLPVKKNKGKIRNRYFNYLLLIKDSALYVSQRKDNDIWHKLYEPVLIETDNEITLKRLENTQTWKELLSGQKYKVKFISKAIKHKLSHQSVSVRFIHILLSKNIGTKMFEKINMEDIQLLPFPVVIRDYLKKI